VFERFTPLARQAVDFAQQEAHDLRHKHIGTEHILLGLLRQREGLAARVLASLDVTPEPVRAQIEHLVLSGAELELQQIPFTPRVKEVFELAASEAASLGEAYVGTEHLLLAIARENKGVAARVLDEFDADSSKIRSEVTLLRAHGPRPPHNRQPIDAVRSDAIEIDLSPRARQLLMSAGARALGAGRTQLEPNDMFVAMLSDATFESMLLELGVDIRELRDRLWRLGGAESDIRDRT
jgi:Clp amino terminal domain, pathogenicity island component